MAGLQIYRTSRTRDIVVPNLYPLDDKLGRLPVHHQPASSNRIICGRYLNLFEPSSIFEARMVMVRFTSPSVNAALISLNCDVSPSHFRRAISEDDLVLSLTQ